MVSIIGDSFTLIDSTWFLNEISTVSKKFVSYNLFNNSLISSASRLSSTLIDENTIIVSSEILSFPIISIFLTVSEKTKFGKKKQY